MMKVMAGRHGNWIGGEERPSKDGLFEVHGRSDGALLGEWPRSGEREVEAALAALGRARPLDRQAMEAALHVSLGRDVVLGARLGLTEAELDRFVRARDPGVFGLGADKPASGRFGLVVAPADGLPAELVRWVLELGSLGRPAVLVAHADLPMAADLARAALRETGVELAVLHGLTPGGWRALGGREAELAVRGVLDPTVRDELAGSEAQVPGLARLLARLAGPREACFELSELAPGGDLSALPVEQLARRLVERALGRSASLGGRARGAPLCGAIPERLYSDFVEASLAEFERLAREQEPLAGPGGGALVKRYKVAWRAGLDEGAVLLAGGVAQVGVHGACLAPTLLVNVPLASASFAPAEPLAQLRLARVPESALGTPRRG